MRRPIIVVLLSGPPPVIIKAFWNGMVILVSTLLQPVSDKVVAALHIERKSAWYQVFSMLRTFVVVLIGYYFDIADGFRAAMGMMLKSVTDLHLSQLRPGAVLEALPDSVSTPELKLDTAEGENFALCERLQREDRQ